MRQTHRFDARKRRDTVEQAQLEVTGLLMGEARQLEVELGDLDAGVTEAEVQLLRERARARSAGCELVLVDCPPLTERAAERRNSSGSKSPPSASR